MMYQTQSIDSIIRGSCALFVCRCCRTKYGWAHQFWCDVGYLIEPTCRECHYYDERYRGCTHPANKSERGDLPYEEDQRPF